MALVSKKLKIGKRLRSLARVVRGKKKTASNADAEPNVSVEDKPKPEVASEPNEDTPDTPAASAPSRETPEPPLVSAPFSEEIGTEDTMSLSNEPAKNSSVDNEWEVGDSESVEEERFCMASASSESAACESWGPLRWRRSSIVADQVESGKRNALEDNKDTSLLSAMNGWLQKNQEWVIEHVGKACPVGQLGEQLNIDGDEPNEEKSKDIDTPAAVTENKVMGDDFISNSEVSPSVIATAGDVDNVALGIHDEKSTTSKMSTYSVPSTETSVPRDDLSATSAAKSTTQEQPSVHSKASKCTAKEPSAASAAKSTSEKPSATVASDEKEVVEKPSSKRRSMIQAIKSFISVNRKGKHATNKESTPSVPHSEKSASRDDLSATSDAKSTTQEQPSVHSKAKSTDKEPYVSAPRDDISTTSAAKSTTQEQLSVNSKASRSKGSTEPRAQMSASSDDLSATSAAISTKREQASVHSKASKSTAKEDFVASAAESTSKKDASTSATSVGKDVDGKSTSQKRSIIQGIKSFVSRAAKSTKSKSKKEDASLVSLASNLAERKMMNSIIARDVSSQDLVTSSIKDNSVYLPSAPRSVPDELQAELAKLQAQVTAISIVTNEGKQELVAKSFLDGCFADNPNLWKLELGGAAPTLPLSALADLEIYAGGNYFAKLRSEEMEAFVEEFKEGTVNFCIEDRVWMAVALTGLRSKDMDKLKKADPTEVFGILLKVADRDGEKCKTTFVIEELQFFCESVPGLMSHVKLSPDQIEQRQAEIEAHEFLGRIVLLMQENGNTDSDHVVVDKANFILDVFMELGVKSSDKRVGDLVKKMMAVQETGVRDLYEAASKEVANSFYSL